MKKIPLLKKSFLSHIKSIAAFTLCLALILPTPVTAAPQVTIVDLQAEGLALIDRGTIFSTIDSRIGSPLNGIKVSNDIRALYKLGFFADIKANVIEKSATEAILIFVLKEKPRINKLTIEGNNFVDNKAWEEELRVFEKNMLNRALVRADLNVIKAKYRKEGYLKADFDYVVTPVRDGWVDLKYVINEAPKVYITEINVTGTKYFDPIDVERIMQSAEIDCFTWVTESGVFQENKVNNDLQIISQTYLQLGFIKVHIDKPKVVLTKSKDLYKLTIDINIEEGEQYFTDSISFSSADGYDLLFDEKEQLEELKLQPTDPYNPFKQNDDRFELQQLYMEQGYAYVNISPQTSINEEEKKVKINFAITRKHKAYIGRVEIKGNYETIDEVVRRELKIHDNELFNGVKLRESQLSVNQLGFFEAGTGVNFQQTKGEHENEVNYDLNLFESQTGTFTASLSYSAFDGIALNFALTKKNFLGTGRTISFSIDRQQSGDSLYDFSFVAPYFFGTQATNDVGVYKRFTQSDQYNTDSNGSRIGFSYPLWKNIYGAARFAYKEETYQDITDIGTEYLNGAESNSYRSLRLSISHSTVNNPMFPSDGGKTSLSTERFGGPYGGTVDYQIFNFSQQNFQSFNDAETIVGMFKFRQGNLAKTSADHDVPMHERFYLGGITTIRGHEWRRIRGPSSYLDGDAFDINETDPYTGDYDDCSETTEGNNCAPDGTATEKSADRLYWEQHPGGNMYRVVNLELLFPLTREGKNIRGVIFYDIGNVWAEDRLYEIRGTQKNYSYLRKSAGFGARFITPMGVVRFEYGIKLDKQPRETPSKFEFNVSGLF